MIAEARESGTSLIPRDDFSVLWTGATGFFGRSLLRHLITENSSNVSMHLLSRDPSKFANHWPKLASVPGTVWHRGDIMNLDEARLPSVDFIVHAAADSTSSKHLNCLQQFDQVLEGTRQVLNLAVASDTKRVLFVSSGAVYGGQSAETVAVEEQYLGMPDPLNPINAYGVAKRSAEHLCALYSKMYGIEVVIARCFAFVGEDLPIDAHFAIGNFIRDALWCDEITVNGDGTPIRSYLDQRDLIRWLLVLLKEGKSGEAFNIGSDQEISIAELAYLVRDLLSPGKRVKIMGRHNENAVRSRYVPDITKICRELGLKPSFSLEQSILDAADGASRRGRPI